MDKNDIFNNIDDFSAEQLFDFINKGIVTLEELRDTGELNATKRKAITTLQNNRAQEDDDFWNASRYTELGCRTYLETYPGGRHVIDAQQLINELQRQHKQEIADRQKNLDKIRKNPNSFTPGMLSGYLKNDTISRSDLINSGIPEDIIDHLDKIILPQLDLGNPPDSIPDGYTEVYFWGLPGSGKTCALAAVLSTANKLGFLEIAQGEGQNYMVKLKNIFSDRISFLPGPSPVDTTQYLPFTLKKPNEKYYRSVSLIELSGEIFECFLFENGNKPLPSPQHEKTFNNLIQLLNGKNRKIHFFFVDYDKENKVDANGYRQSDYLEAAATYFNNGKNNLFNKTTDAIYIVLTKSDLMDCKKSEQKNQISQYLQNNNFSSFVNSLRSKCKENSINGGRILATPFALGNVYFQQMCVFEDETSLNIIDILMRRIPQKKSSILDVFNK